MLRGEARDLAAKIRVRQPIAEHVDEVVVGLDDPPGRANGIVVGIAGHLGDVPALHDPLGRNVGQVVIVPKPVASDEIAFKWNWPLLKLR
ncbi:MAG TPA: hypothetical protein VKG24_10510 [Pseudolabrys sp.]|nr:hypothetical protein [Pseudolabrys sp.]